MEYSVVDKPCNFGRVQFPGSSKTIYHRIRTIAEVSLRYVIWHHFTFALHMCSMHPIYLLVTWWWRLSQVFNHQHHVTSLKMLYGYRTSELL